MKRIPSPWEPGDMLYHDTHGFGTVITVRPNPKGPDTITILYLGGQKQFVAGSAEAAEWRVQR